MRLRHAIMPALAAAMLALSACGSSEEPADDDETTPQAQASEPITVTDARGEEVTLDAPAENVVALEWAETEALVTLGVMPSGVADVDGYSTWVGASAPLGDDVTDVGTRQEPSVDSIVALDPDLVIMEDRGNPVAEQLEEYVPVIVIQGADASRNIEQMKENFTTIATAVGKEAEAEQVLSDFDAALDDGRQQIADAGHEGEKFLMADGWMEGSAVSIRMFGEGSLVSDLGEELGLENAWTEGVDAEWGLGQTDVEGLADLPDLHFFYSASDADDVFADGLSGNAIWESLPFVESGQIHKLAPGTWTFGGPASCMFIVEQFVDALTA
ncbi:iron-siderophore ABC transporter substrate-binding protein [Phytoactinopolyspora alkaliphila]|uniref:Iron-siderophore ABC transporter substrate-binding protein n=1 Tax=Phytoactinopolyspora alkaliphila TaxID=1783498 RepID=A0A6N9YTB3_9ACTN|nr:iron-siderophore ABC transporter substrate-binding protein [Phytoactinopolyspora alkaliphila]NED98167.1 iron-siderophore ABC transporter substrate-binding protein [Phytoactinopolyspora alkaliphila]